MSVEFKDNSGIIDEKVLNGLTKACLVLEKAAKENCPVGDTGLLRASITHWIDGLKGTVGTNVEYAPYVHQGTGIYALEGNGRKDVPWCYKDSRTGELIFTSGQHPNPFLQKAIDENTQEILEAFKGAMMEK